jgi:hypothetical protein
MAFRASAVSSASSARAPFHTAVKRSILPQASSSRAVMPRGTGLSAAVHS